MRCAVEIQGKNIIKRVDASPYVANLAFKEFADYSTWLLDADIGSVDTDIDYQEGKLVFTQPHLQAQQFAKPVKLIQSFMRLDYSCFGLDSNPGNFMGDVQPVNVDFYPFLIRDHKCLADQFDYPVSTAIKRYFVRENVIATYTARLFKISEELAMAAISEAAPLFVNAFDQILPREKLRLLNGLQLSALGDLTSFPTYYEKSKEYSEITEKDEQLLLSRLQKFSS